VAQRRAQQEAPPERLGRVADGADGRARHAAAPRLRDVPEERLPPRPLDERDDVAVVRVRRPVGRPHVAPPPPEAVLEARLVEARRPPARRAPPEKEKDVSVLVFPPPYLGRHGGDFADF